MTTAMTLITVILHTNMGAITLELDKELAPTTTQNFVSYAKSDFYNGTVFHRVIDGFMIQGGGLNTDMTSKPTNDSIKNEANNGLKNKTGTIAMARTNDPHSATSQFFINIADNDFLNFKSETADGWGYCVFGKVTNGMDVVNKISHVNTVNKSGHQDVPERDIILKKVEIVGSSQKQQTQGTTTASNAAS